MKIETKLSIGDVMFFMIQNKVYNSKVVRIEIVVQDRNSFIIERYFIKENPAGSHLKTMFDNHEVFKTKQDLLDSL